ncbi:MAG: hypothetical protein AB9897_06785 [Anaerolineaceae bacterium]
MTPLSFTQIIIIIVVIAGLIIAMRLIQPKLSSAEKYLLHEIQFKSPQMDNIRLYMWVKMVIKAVASPEDLEYQQRFLSDPSQFKMLSEQFYGFGAFALFPLLGYEAINWQLATNKENTLMLRLASILVIRRFPHTAAVVEDLLARSPDEVSTKYFARNHKDFPSINEYQGRYFFNLHEILKIITTTSRNEWWPGTSPDIREWAENVLNRSSKKIVGNSDKGSVE